MFTRVQLANPIIGSDIGLATANGQVTGEFPAHMASNAENASIWWRHHDVVSYPFHKFIIDLVHLSSYEASLKLKKNERTYLAAIAIYR